MNFIQSRLARWSLLGALILATAGALGSANTAFGQAQRTAIGVSPVLRAAGAQYERPYLDVYANGQLCGRLSFTDAANRTADDGAEFELGTAVQPAACTTEGATITLIQGNGVQLTDTYRLTVGSRIAIANFNIPPIATDAPATPVAPATGNSIASSGGQPALAPMAAGVGILFSLAGLMAWAGRGKVKWASVSRN